MQLRVNSFVRMESNFAARVTFIESPNTVVRLQYCPNRNARATLQVDVEQLSLILERSVIDNAEVILFWHLQLLVVGYTPRGYKPRGRRVFFFRTSRSVGEH
jgi:hypothetical protein